MKKSKVKGPNREELKALIVAIGGPVKLRSLLTLFYERMAQDLMIGFFFEGRDLKKIVDGQTQFILMASGFIERFEGKGPSTAHVALPPILAGHFDRRLILLREVLSAEGVPEQWIALWIRFEESFRLVVVSEEVQHSPSSAGAAELAKKKGTPET